MTLHVRRRYWEVLLVQAGVVMTHCLQSSGGRSGRSSGLQPTATGGQHTR